MYTFIIIYMNNPIQLPKQKKPKNSTNFLLNTYFKKISLILMIIKLNIGSATVL